MRFVISGLARSRHAWFSAYFTNGVETCHFEAIPNRIEIADGDGTADPGYLVSPKWIAELGPHRLVIIHRPIDEVMPWWEAKGLDPSHLVALEQGLDSFKDALHIDFHDINERLGEIHNWIGIPWDQERADLFVQLNIQAEKYRVHSET